MRFYDLNRAQYSPVTISKYKSSRDSGQPRLLLLWRHKCWDTKQTHILLEAVSWRGIGSNGSAKWGQATAATHFGPIVGVGIVGLRRPVHSQYGSAWAGGPAVARTLLLLVITSWHSAAPTLTKLTWAAGHRLGRHASASNANNKEGRNCRADSYCCDWKAARNGPWI